MKTKRFVVLTLLAILLLTVFACSDGISQEDYDAVVAERNSLVGELEALQAKCPPSDFSSLTELETWLLANNISNEAPTTYADGWLRKALRLQQDALEDGYLISIDYDWVPGTDTCSVYCTTVINGRLFYWDPETDEVFEEFAFGTLQ